MTPSESIVDDLGLRVTCSTTMRLLCLAWIAPAVALVWTGFASIGLRSTTGPALVRDLERIQAVAVLLAIFGCLIGLMWALRSLDDLPAVGRIGVGPRWLGPWSHVVSAAVSGGAGLVTLTDRQAHPRAAVVVAAAGFYAVLLVARWLLLAPIVPSLPLALLAATAGFQVTIGWLPIGHPTGVLAPVVVIVGLAMIWTALAAARVVAAHAVFVGAPVAGPVSAGSAAVDMVSRAPAPLSLQEPAVGR